MGTKKANQIWSNIYILFMCYIILSNIWEYSINKKMYMGDFNMAKNKSYLHFIQFLFLYL